MIASSFLARARFLSWNLLAGSVGGIVSHFTVSYTPALPLEFDVLRQDVLCHVRCCGREWKVLEAVVAASVVGHHGEYFRLSGFGTFGSTSHEQGH